MKKTVLQRFTKKFTLYIYVLFFYSLLPLQAQLTIADFTPKISVTSQTQASRPMRMIMKSLLAMTTILLLMRYLKMTQSCLSLGTESATSGKVKVRVNGVIATSMDDFTYLAPRLINFNPKTGRIGEVITITGENFPFYLFNEVIFGNGNGTRPS